MINTVKMISVISAAVLLPAVAFAETEKSEAPPSWYDKFTVGATSDGNKINNNKDASINFTSPGDGEDFYAVNIGIAYGLLMESERWSVEPVMEYHRNTSLNQDVILGGMKGSYLIGDVVTAELSPSLAVWTDAELIHKWDEVKDDQSWMSRVAFTPLYSPLALGSSIAISDLLRVQPSLSGGLVYEDAASGEDGDTLRARVEAGVTFIPQGVLEDALQLRLSNTYWNELTASGKFDDGKDDFNLIEIAATYYLINDKEKSDRLGVQLTYQDGANPETGREDQSAVTFGFVFSL